MRTAFEVDRPLRRAMLKQCAAGAHIMSSFAALSLTSSKGLLDPPWCAIAPFSKGRSRRYA